MKSSESREADMLALWIDLAEADQPAPELLLRYARDPESIPPEQRRALQARIENSPELADQLRVIDRFDWSRIAPPVEAPVAPRPVRTPSPRRSWFSIKWLWAPTLALASVTALVVYPLLQSRSPAPEPGSLASLDPAPKPATPGAAGPDSRPRPTELAQAERQEDAARQEQAREMQALAQARQQARQADSDARRQEARNATGESRSDEPPPPADAPATGPATRLASRPEATATESAKAGAETRVAQAASPPPAERPATAARPARAAAPEADSAAPAAGQPEAEPAAGVTLLAMAEPLYSAPFADDRAATLIRGGTERPALRAIVPDHLARTSRAEPVLVWHLARTPGSRERLELMVEREDNGELLVETELAGPGSSGLQRLDLAAHMSAVPEGVPLAWTLLLLDSDDPSRDAIASARLLRVGLDAATRSALAAANPGEKPAIYAAAGLWYDALAEALALREAHPDNPSVQRGLDLLLRQGGFEDLLSR